MLFAACADARVPTPDTVADADSTDVARQAADSGSSAAADGAAGIAFDPATIGPGDAVGTLVLDSIAPQPALDSSQVGSAWFAGEIELTGAAIRHFDADAAANASCFEADAASAARLPRWRGDERRAWFCFDNGSDAVAALGPPGDGARATIIIDRFTIHRSLSDAVNEAHFVRRIE